MWSNKEKGNIRLRLAILYGTIHMGGNDRYDSYRCLNHLIITCEKCTSLASITISVDRACKVSTHTIKFDENKISRLKSYFCGVCCLGNKIEHDKQQLCAKHCNNHNIMKSLAQPFRYNKCMVEMR